jgi:TonB family protein
VLKKSSLQNALRTPAACGPFFLLLCLSCVPLRASAAPTQLAIINLKGDERGEFTAALRAAAKRSASDLSLIDDDQAGTALRGLGYGGGLNLSLDEARAVGLSVGCDFFVVGQAYVARRIASADEFYFDAVAALFLVETKSGRLLKFRFGHAANRQEAGARAQLVSVINADWTAFDEAIAEARRRKESGRDVAARAAIPDLDEPPSSNITPPVFYQRLKPKYTDEARLAGVAATVELEVVFQADGRVGGIEVVRWAGFGLDESAVATARQLRFKPAELGGRQVSVRARVQYNFR